MPKLKPTPIDVTDDEDAAITAAAMSDPDAQPFTHARSHANLRINRFLHALTRPDHRARFVNDFEALATEHA